MGFAVRQNPSGFAKDQWLALCLEVGFPQEEGALWRVGTGADGHLLFRDRGSLKDHLDLGEQKHLVQFHHSFIRVAQCVQVPAGGILHVAQSGGKLDPPV